MRSSNKDYIYNFTAVTDIRIIIDDKNGPQFQRGITICIYDKNEVMIHKSFYPVNTLSNFKIAELVKQAANKAGLLQ